MLKNSKIEIFSKEISKFTNLDDLLKLYQSHPFDLKILKWINKLNNPQFAITLMQISGSDFKLLHDSNQSTTYLNSITEDQKTKLTEGIGFILKYYKEMSAEYPISNSEKLIDYTQQICKKNDTQSMTNRNYLFHVYQEQIKNNIQSENINNVIELCFNIFKLKQGALFEQEANAIFDAAYHWVYEKIVSLHRDDLRPHATILKKSILFAPSPLNALEQLKVINLLIKINPAIFEDNQLAELYHSISEDLPDDNRLELYRALFGVQKIPAVLMPTIIHDMCATYSKIKNPALTTFMIEKLNKILAEESINFHIESDDLIFLIKKKFLNRNQLIRYTINNLSNYNESNRTKILNCLWKISCKDQDFLNDLTEQLNNNTDSKIESLKKCCSVLLMLREIEKRDDLKPLKITMSEPNTKELSKLLGQYTKGPLTNPTTQLKEFFASINDDSPELYIQKMMQSNITELHPIDLLKEEYEVFISKINQLNTSNTDHHDAIRNLYLMHKAGRITHENIQSAIKTKYSEYQTAIASINSIPTIKALSQGSHPILLTPLQELSTFKERLENSSNLETLTSLLNNEEFKELISTSNPPQEFGYTINKTKDLMLSILQHSQDKKEKEDLIRRIYKYELDKHSVEQQKLSENLEKSEQQSSNELFEELKYLYIVQPLVKDTVLSVPLTTDMQEKVKQQMQDNPEPFKTIKYKLPSQLQEILDLEQPILVPTNQSDNQ
ncbi:MAG: hypothetical protein FJ161_02895, partial [Gammaproteobacteria bacterium]|nr:hypothetical protein [Gammaproteobacteria bacterium]